MGSTEAGDPQRASLLAEIADLERQLASLKSSLPVHSLSPAMFQRIEDLEYEIEQKRAALQEQTSPPNSQSND